MRIAIAEPTGLVAELLRENLRAEDDVIDELRIESIARPLIILDDLRVVIIDWALSNHGDMAICRQVRRREPGRPYVFVIALIQPTDHAERSFAYTAGADFVVPKPVVAAELLAQLVIVRRISRHAETLRARSAKLEQARLDLETANVMLAEIASRDALTGLRNRGFFCETLDAEFARARRGESALSLVMIDVDQFKSYNDVHGHLAGDEVLRDVGDLLRRGVRPYDIVARYGGEEFAILLPTAGEGELLPMVDRLRLSVAHHPWSLRPVTISLGVATLGPAEARPADLIDQADRALYYSKAMGRNRTTLSSELADPSTRPPSRHPIGDGPQPGQVFHISDQLAS